MHCREARDGDLPIEREFHPPSANEKAIHCRVIIAEDKPTLWTLGVYDGHADATNIEIERCEIYRVTTGRKVGAVKEISRINIEGHLDRGIVGNGGKPASDHAVIDGRENLDLHSCGMGITERKGENGSDEGELFHKYHCVVRHDKNGHVKIRDITILHRSNLLKSRGLLNEIQQSNWQP